MIKNERQYRITKAQAERFARALSALAHDKKTSGVHPVLRKAEEDALRSQLFDLRAELGEYEALSTGKRKTLVLESFEGLPRVLIQGRIAAGLTQEQLAARLKLKPQQIQRYEATGYAAASLARITAVTRALGVKVREEVFLPRSRTGRSRKPRLARSQMRQSSPATTHR